MTTPNTTTIEICENAYEITPIFGWGWPDESRLAAFAEQDVQAAQADRAEMAHRLEQAEQPGESTFEYAVLYFVS